VERYIPKEEGLLEVKLTRTLSSLTLKLTTKPTQADRASAGFHEPLPKEEVQVRSKYSYKNYIIHRF
jgi:hypothetical protein